MDLKYVKKYLNIEDEYIEDDIFINNCIAAAIAYVCNYTGLTKLDIDNNETLKIAVLLLISHFYDIRSVQIDSNSKLNFALKSILDMNKVNWL